MPFRAKAWLVVRAALFPLWAAITLTLHLLGALGTLLQNLVEGEPLRTTFLASRAIGMYSTGTPEPPEDDRPANRYKLPQYIPLTEAMCFVYTHEFNGDPSGTGIAVGLRLQRREGKRWPNRALAILLTLCYLVQATATIALVVRRANYLYLLPANLSFMAMEPNAVTPFEIQAIFLALYGVFVAVIYIVLQVVHLEWVHTHDRWPWTYKADPMWVSIRRSLLGLCGTLMLHDAVEGALDIETLPVLYLRPVSYATDLIIHLLDHYRSWLFLSVLVLLACVRLRLQRFKVLFRKAFGWLTLIGGLKVVAAVKFKVWPTLRECSLGAFDYARQDPTEHHVARGLDLSPTSPDDTPASMRSQRRALLAVQLFYCCLALPYLLFLFLDHSSVFHDAKSLSEPIITYAGCVYETELKGWMWKDPLADRLWAF